ncbi:LysR family transcriptional regulator [uncultured Sphaerochaeta sp.]|uniref:winged helix-turn-helix domain-containing protein n=1 Tax=uncultured Sphaerochaeta sp. TaxID=886478 RepID=UPI002A0A28FE|nr:LysR family transcriptional regulator [uncultured Sphaerochaeta sp.]
MLFSCSLKIRFREENLFYGPGVNQLLHMVEKEKSLAGAAFSMRMSYSKAWKIIREAERSLGYPLTEKSIGGSDGGGSLLTEQGRSFMQRYDAFSLEAGKAVDSCFQTYFPEANQ